MVYFYDDVATQQSLMISARMWRRLIKPLHQRIIEGDLMSGAGSVSQLDISDSYFERIVEDIALLSDPLPVAVDCGNGIAGRYAPRLLAALGCEVTPLFCEVNGNFPNHHPDPTIPENLEAQGAQRYWKLLFGTDFPMILPHKALEGQFAD